MSDLGAQVFTSGRISVLDMAKPGVVFNLFGVVLITGTMFTLGEAVYGIQDGVVPDWATLTPATG